MPTPHPDDIISQGEDVRIFTLIRNFHNVSYFEDAPKNSIDISKLKFYKNGFNPENDYLQINFNNRRFKSWNKLSWIDSIFGFKGLRSFKLGQRDYEYLMNFYSRENSNDKPTTLHAVYCIGPTKPFVVFFFELYEGPGLKGNSIGVKIPKGAV